MKKNRHKPHILEETGQSMEEQPVEHRAFRMTGSRDSGHGRIKASRTGPMLWIGRVSLERGDDRGPEGRIRSRKRQQALPSGQKNGAGGEL